MKKIFFIFVFYYSLFITHYSLSQSWDSCRTGLATVTPAGILKYQSLTYLATNSNGVFYSSNNGSTWFPFYTWSGLSSSWFSSIIEKNGNLFAGSRNSGIFKSTDLGYSWRRSDTGITNKQINTIINFNNKLYAATYGAGIFISTNDGLNWYPSNTGIDDLSLYYLKNYGTNLYTFTYSNFYKSTNEGISWSKLYNSGGYEINDVCEKDNILFMGMWYRGMYRSTNNGANWIQISVDTLGTNISAVHLHNNILYANSTESGIYRSTDNGNIWTKCSYRLGSCDVKGMFSINNELYAYIDYDGLYESTNNGNVWFPLNNKFLPYSASPSHLRSQGNIVMGIESYSSVIVSTNSGYTWSAYASPNYVIDDFLLYNNYAFGVGWNGLVFSTDYGITWNKHAFHPNNAYSVICKKDNAIYFGGRDTVLYKSTDFVTTFTSIITSGLPLDNFVNLRAKGNYLFAGLYNHSIYRSSDNGLNWTLLSNGLPALTYTRLFVSDSAVYAWAYQGSSIYRSTNNGDNWSTFAGRYAIQELYVSEPYAFYYTNLDGGYMTTNSGLTWTYISQFGYSNFGQFVISQNYVIGSAYSLMRSKLFDITNVNGNVTKAAGKYELLQNYPNPFNPVTTIGFTIPKTSNVNIKIFDVTGKLIKTLVNEKFETGVHSVIFYAGDLASGIYFYRIAAGDFIKTKKLTLVK